MYSLISRLLVYKKLDEDSLVLRLAETIKECECLSKDSDFDLKKVHIISDINTVINELLELATIYGFDENLWHNYLTYLIINQENPFSLLCESSGVKEGTVNDLVKEDFIIFKKLFDYDFGPLEKSLSIKVFTHITNYKAIKKDSRLYNKDISQKIRGLSKEIDKAKDENEIFDKVTDFYKKYGVGKLGLNKAFRISKTGERNEIEPITNTQEVRLSDLIGYESQKQKIYNNTKAFVEGKKANNVLLYGDSGTGKSTTIKAIVNEFYGNGLRMIEVYKHQFKDLIWLTSQIKNRNYKFIIYMDDLSFEEFEIEYKYLKAIIEGGLEIKPDNVLVYATSNRRHIIRETWSDRTDMDKDGEIHRSDTMQEKLSLVDRFGLTINFSAPSNKDYQEIVKGIAKAQGIQLPQEELLSAASRWELLHGGKSGRTAQQFIDYISSLE